ncbi:GNAT family N-acetyltransferase [Herbiconiux daphne]|uniref:GNAT family N-acetyltransferase n=1 Tax=Herbiconiux daphne TaxID=2970914 RepID=A0ABT2HAX0_9MICO|nr:GNAT family N-acetyltransferase [Herbiconiux daphne]MCS5737091.1 GNAT family N-acetyltransferase [Herbiconiux daphne]
MITVIETHDGSEEAFEWFRDKLYPEWSLEYTVNRLNWYFDLSEARRFQFYHNGEHVGFLACEQGFTLHYPAVVNISTVIHPNAHGNRALLKVMLEQAKQVCREAGIPLLVRSVHLTPSVSRVNTTRVF